MLKGIFITIVAVFALVGACALAAGAWFMNGGINSKQQPGPTETTIARKLRAAAIPDRAKKAGNPDSRRRPTCSRPAWRISPIIARPCHWQ
mgnify:CR=1 FL=1